MVDRRRKWRAQHQDISIVESRASGEYAVNGTEGDRYKVDIDAPFCECPDWQKRSPRGGCKHILHVKLIEGNLDPLPNAYTDHDPEKSHSPSNYTDWDTLSRRTKKRDNWECQKCGAQGGAYGRTNLHAHHIVSKSKGGDDAIENLITVCQSCHEDLHGHSIPNGRSSFGSINSNTSTSSTRKYSANSTANPASNGETEQPPEREARFRKGRQQKLWQYQEGERHPVDEPNMPICQSSSSGTAKEKNSVEEVQGATLSEQDDTSEPNTTPTQNGAPESTTSPAKAIAILIGLIMTGLSYLLLVILIA